jgi:hypothetical protein
MDLYDFKLAWTRFWTGEMFPDPDPENPEIERVVEGESSIPDKGECFCGCGERIGFTSRGVNKQGRRTVEQLKKLRTIEERTKRLRSTEGVEFQAASDEFLEALRYLIIQGEGYESDWEDIVHFDHVPVEGIMNFKRSWNEWGRATFTLAPIYKSQDDAVLRSVILGMTN